MCKPAIVIEAALLVRPEPFQRRRAIAFVRRTVGLEVVDADLGGFVRIPARLGEQRRHVAGGALRFAVEECFAARGGLLIVASFRAASAQDRELIEVKRASFAVIMSWSLALVAETGFGGNRILLRVVQAARSKKVPCPASQDWRHRHSSR